MYTNYLDLVVKILFMSNFSIYIFIKTEYTVKFNESINKYIYYSEKFCQNVIYLLVG